VYYQTSTFIFSMSSGGDQSLEPMDTEDVEGVPNLQEVRQFELEEMDLDFSNTTENQGNVYYDVITLII